jgi:SAM-dependent methyltransferase
MTDVTDVDVPPADPRLYAILAESGFADGPFDARQHRACALVDRYVRAHAVALIAPLGIGGAGDVEALRVAGGLVERFRRPLRWLLDMLVLAGAATRDAGRYVVGAGGASRLEALREAILATDPSYVPTVALLDEAALAWPRVARGETTGERALFQRVALWPAYFSNRNAYYALNNLVAARAAAARVPATAAHVLEVGGGLGSATEALLALAQPARFAAYRFTEPVPFFRRRAERTIRDTGLPVVAGTLDLNEPWDVPEASQHLVWGVNVFHLARDLDATLRRAGDALAPGGWLVVGEGIRPLAGEPVGAEFPFVLLDAFADVAIDAHTRPDPGFLTARQWTDALARAGFASIALVPDVERLAAIQPTFYAAAVCGRRP